jgi:hypothetical protein
MNEYEKNIQEAITQLRHMINKAEHLKWSNQYSFHELGEVESKPVEQEEILIWAKNTNDEIRMWRKRYCEQVLFDDTELVRESFIAIPTIRFALNSPEEVVEYLRKIEAGHIGCLSKGQKNQM